MSAHDDEDPPAEIEVEITDSIDLHTFAPRDIATVVEAYLEAARDKGLREVRLIHGKGTGFQRDRVQRILAATDFVEEFFDAPPGRGFWGATVARLRQPVSAS